MEQEKVLILGLRFSICYASEHKLFVLNYKGLFVAVVEYKDFVLTNITNLKAILVQ